MKYFSPHVSPALTTEMTLCIVKIQTIRSNKNEKVPKGRIVQIVFMLFIWI